MKTQIVQQNNRKTTIEYFSRSVEVSTSTTRKTKIFLDNLIQGSVELFVPSSQDSLSFASKTNVTQVVNTTKTSIVQNIAGKTFLSGVTNLTVNQTVLGTPDHITIDFVSGDEVLAHKILTTDSLGRVIHASADNLDHISRIVGVVENAGSIGDTVGVRKSGVLSNIGWNFTPKQNLYLGLNGDIVTDPNQGLFSNYIGYALTQTQIFINIGRSVIRG